LWRNRARRSEAARARRCGIVSRTREARDGAALLPSSSRLS
jgi:hypothetical protein